MIDREKLIKALEQHCDTKADCNSCPYEPEETSIKCRDSLLCDCLEALKKPQWISVKDRLPIIQDDYALQHGIIVCDAHKNVHLTRMLITIEADGTILYFDDSHSDCFWTIVSNKKPKYNTLIKGNEITHWMPIPELPEGVMQDD